MFRDCSCFLNNNKRILEFLLKLLKHYLHILHTYKLTCSHAYLLARRPACGSWAPTLGWIDFMESFRQSSCQKQMRSNFIEEQKNNTSRHITQRPRRACDRQSSNHTDKVKQCKHGKTKKPTRQVRSFDHWGCLIVSHDFRFHCRFWVGNRVNWVAVEKLSSRKFRFEAVYSGLLWSQKKNVTSLQS